MYEGKTVGVVVPAYNEEDQVGEVIDTMPAFVDRVYAVDDASTDGTWNQIRARAALSDGAGTETAEAEVDPSPHVVGIRHERNRGAGGAVKTGYERALADGIDVTAVMDGDGQMDPDDLDRLIDPIVQGEVTYAKGNRLHRSEDRAAMPRWRQFGNWLLTMLTRASSGYWEVSDPQNGFTAISYEGLRRTRFETLYERYGFLNDMLAALNRNDEPIADVAHESIYGDERSGITYSTFVPGLSWLLARNFVRRLGTSYVVHRFHPLVVCYLLGAIVTVVGVAGVVHSLTSSAVDGFLGGMVSFAVATLGSLLLVLGIWFDVEENEGLVQRVEDPDRRRRPLEDDRIVVSGDAVRGRERGTERWPTGGDEP